MTAVKSWFSPGLLWKQRRRRASLSTSGPLWSSSSPPAGPFPHRLCILVCVPGKTHRPREEPNPPCPEQLAASQGKQRWSTKSGTVLF